ncbi:MAG: CotH kinase family protein [Deltaproteobacteria bacterium]|nr:CotH kinase family protein [Deltaproteobacteria bacterium]
MQKSETINARILLESPETVFARSCKDEADWHTVLIKRRGNSSDWFDKKQFKIEVVDKDGKDKEISLAGLPENSEFALHSSYVDRSFMRNAFIYRLGRKVGEERGERWAAPRTVYLELVLNGQYNGLYVLVETVGRDKNRVDLPKLDQSNFANFSYILEVSAADGYLSSDKGTRFRNVYPSRKKIEELKDVNLLLHNLVVETMNRDLNGFEKALASKNFKDPERGYRPFVNLDSFVDYFIIQEVMKNLDGFRRSMYFHKDQGKLVMGPIWDFDLALGNLRFYGMERYKGWVHRDLYVVYPSVIWFRRMMEDPYFKAQVKVRYQKLRKPGGLLDPDTIVAEIEQLNTELGMAPERDQCRWVGTRNFIEEHFMKTKETSSTHDGNVDIMKRWFFMRLGWLDRKIAKF